MKYSGEMAELVGLSFGDGSLTRRPGTNNLRFQLRGDSREDKDHYYDFVIPLCNKLIGRPFLGKNVGVITDIKKNCFGVSVESSKIEEFFTKLGVPIGHKKELSIPDWILSTKKFYKSFLRGFFDTDGSVHFSRSYAGYRSKRHIVLNSSITSISENIINEISSLLQLLEIKHCLIKPYNNPKTNDKPKRLRSPKVE